ncbi:GNAT family N-acetyltransferase [Vagococcus sp. BWB3-3]|uniref:GNAT family N-acetyltransferase n=1 Tax=Vagococcus allomyrinae TaxID=2794353 RepID=A0A940PGF3_9ENTE|nr:GNAT family N-acetyltransferase [Vagococcus allomyrinae]MBP1043086.1 GNAT family N-acetyltransferase [Vagococcus allomyrinae]
MIREMIASDIQDFPLLFADQGWEKPVDIFQMYYDEQQKQQRIVLVAMDNHGLIGYVTVVPSAKAGPFFGLPEIKDFNVLEKYQGLGYGRALLAAAETQIARMSDVATIGVGLHSGYGAAQMMYIRSGYVPDGGGVWYRDQLLGQNQPCLNDDDLVLYFSKNLRLK